MKKLYLFLFLFYAHLTLSAQQVTCGVFTFDVLITPVTCNGDCDGAIQITNISGGTPSYSYTWSTGSTVPSIFNLCTDDYTVFISDAMGDTCSMTFTVPQPDSLLVFESVFDASCAGCCDGYIQLTVIGGTPPYNYVFTPSGSQGFCPGGYSYCVFDANGCSTCDTATVSFTTFINKDKILGDFSIYPNPTKGNFTITHNLDDVPYVLEIVDLMGKVVHSENIPIAIGTTKQTISTEQLSTGVYFVNLKSDNGKLVYITKMSIVN